MNPRLGLVSYLNTSPFRYGLQELGHTNWINEVPSRLLPLLESGEVEAAVLPALDALTHPELPLLPGSCIASHGTAYSVRLFSRIPLRQATTVALDTSSHTSAALTRIVLAHMGCSPAFIPMAPDLDAMLSAADAALLIGDPCMRADSSGLVVTDLGEEWLRLTGLPFVFAVWAARPGSDLAALTSLIARAKEIGRAAVEQVAREGSQRLGLDRELCLVYLRDHMRYDLTEPELAALEKYRQLCVAQNLIPDTGRVRVELEAGA
jgi:chorismate dehydratase